MKGDPFYKQLLRYRVTILLLLMGIFAVGCRTAATFAAGMMVPVVVTELNDYKRPESSVTERQTFKGNYSTIWNTALTYLQDQNIMIQAADRKSGLLSTDHVRVSSSRLEEISTNDDLLYGYGRFKLSFYFSKTGARTVQVRIVASVEGYNRLEKRMRILPSSGELEKDILESLKYSLVLRSHS